MSSSWRRAMVVSLLAIPVTVLTASMAVPTAVAVQPGAEAPPAQTGGEPQQAGTCVVTWTESRYRNFGYDHIVHLENECGEAVECTVTTDSNPSPVTVQVAPAAHLEVMMFRGSPARAFTAHVDCRPVIA